MDTVMGMAVMASTASNKSSRRFLVLALLVPALAWAGDWKITPRITLSEVYSDNPDLVSSSQAKSDWITEITPGISIQREGGRMKVQADYRMTGLVYASDSSRNDIYHGLDGKAFAELVQDWFYVDATARISQQLREGASSGDTGVVGVGGVGGIGGGVGGGGQVGISGINNTSQVGAYSISPYLKRRLGSFATVEARVAFDDVISDDSQTSDGRKTRYRLSAVSGNLYYPLTWSASYDKSETNNSDSDDTGDDRASLNARYALSKKFGLLARASLEKNDFTGVDEDEEDYKTYGLGVFYTPSRRFSADVYYNHSNNNGNFVSGSATLNPTLHTSLKASTSQRSFGRTYGLNLSHRTRQSNWTLNYQEDLTDTKQQFLDYAGTLYAHSCAGAIIYSNSPIPPAGCNAVPGLNINLVNQSQTDETYTSKILSGAVTYTRRRSTFLLSTYLNKRDYQSSGGDEKTYGLQGSWNLKTSPRTTFTLSGGMSKEESSNGGDGDDLWNLGLAVTHQFDSKVSANVGLRHQQRSSDQPGDSYKENAVAARLNVSF
jgi:uncharacterized protein (PEP-CTERM system associated)